MADNFDRYSCQILLPGFGWSGQTLLQQASVLVIGAGGLGCPVALYLASSGVGTLGIADDDVVSVSNLHRQILFSEQDAGRKKVVAAAERLRQQNPQVKIVEHAVRISRQNILEITAPYDIIVDATDNFGTRYLVNDAGVLTGKPVVYGAIYQYEGQVAVWNVPRADGSRSPHYRDVFPQVNAAMVPDCSVGGVTPPIAGMIGCMQANEVIKLITGTGEPLAGKLLVMDAATLQSRVIGIGGSSRVRVTELPDEEPVPEITAAELRQGEPSNWQLVDVRTDAERAMFHIGGLHTPLAMLESSKEYLQALQPVVFYCASGKRSAEAVRQIRRSNPEAQVYSLAGGIKAWRQALEHSE